MIAFERQSEVGGARVVGIDPAEPLTPDDLAAINAAFLEYLVLVFAPVSFEAPAFAAFSRQFGKLQPHVAKRYRHPRAAEVVMMTNVDAAGRFDRAGAQRGALEWHSDLCYEALPAKATLLHALELPSRGGDTLFANMYLAYETMPAALRERVDGLQCHCRYGGRKGYGLREVLAKPEQEAPAVVHPVIRVHPDTGRRSVYANPYHTVDILGMDRGESSSLLDELFDWCRQPQFQFRHPWTVGETIMWENRSAWHRGLLDYPLDQRRVFMRTTVRGTVPVSA